MNGDREGATPFGGVAADAAPAHTNRLADEKSPYLLQHAHNPVDWYPWGDEAFERARLEDKPIFLSIGYSTCHWCHVMERESFEDEDVAGLLNQDFVSIKLDREERPDIDGVYMTVCQITTGHGGWPLTVVMTPDRKPFFAGTYFPRESRGGRIGMLDLLPRLSSLWRERRGEVLRSAESILAAVRAAERPGAGAGSPSTVEPMPTPGQSPLGEDALERGYDELASRFDRLQGGFGGAPKFPTPHQFLFLLRYHDRSGEPHALEMVEKTLRSMRRGGIFDHIGFGFHRYSTDARWLLPHFEKMLYDQALLAMAYAETWLVTKRPEYRRVAEEILTYVLRDMTDTSGGFYSAEDADSEGREGKFYLWTVEELARILPAEDAALVRRVYQLERRGNFADEATGARTGENIPRLRESLAETARQLVDTGQLETGPDDAEDVLRARLERIRAAMFEARESRVHPLKDDKILTDWNGLMIAAMALAGRAFGESEYTRAAERAARFLLETLRDEGGRLLHRYRDGEAALPATAADHAFLVWGLIELYQATFTPRWLAEALRLHRELVDGFWDEEGGGFFTAAADASDLPVRQKEAYDGATPSANSVAWLNGLRLARLTGEVDLEELAARQEVAFARRILRAPSAYAMWLLALDFRVGPAHEVVIAASDPDEGEAVARETRGHTGDASGAETLVGALRARFLPRAVVLRRPGGAAAEELIRIAPFTAGHVPVGGRAAAYVCTGFACQAPVTDPVAMLRALGLED